MDIQLRWVYDKVISTFSMQMRRSIQLSMTFHAVLMCTKVQTLPDGGYNQMAEKTLLAALQKAKEVSASRIVTDKQVGILTAHVVGVASSATPVRYTFKGPHLRFACCECESAVQHRTCKYQLAVLMNLFPGLESRRAMLMFLGTRLGMKGGCQPDRSAPDSLRPLFEKLQQLRAADDKPLLALPDPAQEHARASSSAGVASVPPTSTSSASCPLEQWGIVCVTRTEQTLQQRADALGKEVHRLFQDSMQR
jgi:hypothetical protein